MLTSRGFTVLLLFSVASLAISGYSEQSQAGQSSLPDAPSHTASKSGSKGKAKFEPASGTDTPWPRVVKVGDQTVSMYQPQVESWAGEELRAYAALSVEKEVDQRSEKGTAKITKYGVMSFTARTEVDKVDRQVTLDDFQITKLQFPTIQEQEPRLKALLQEKLAGKSRVVALDRLETAWEASDSSEANIKGFPVKNDPPEIIIETRPALLVLIDGPPKFRDVGGTDLRLVLNTRAVIVLDPEKKKYYLSVLDGWMDAQNLEGPWSYASKIPDDMKEIAKGIVERQQANVEEGSKPPSLKQAKKDGKIPTIYTRFTPTELLVMEGAPQFEPIREANLEDVKNTSANIFRDPANQNYYVLLAGRWFRSKSLGTGSWTFVERASLPEGFARIPNSSPKAIVLASVPGTPPAKEALIANSIPQTATITRSEAQLRVEYDGEPQFKDIPGTQLQYAVNTATPVIRVTDKNYYAVENAVWFVAAWPRGPWAVATAVPEEIYAIPPSAPLHYVTYVKVYGSTPETVNEGYTPGYYGSVVSSETTTVVYGTGFYYPPYVGNYWYGAPYTYGVGVASTWTSESGWSLTIGVGYSYAYGYPYYYYPWWGPWGYYGYCCWGPAWGYGWGGYASANVYGRWGNTAYANTRAAWANPYTGNYGAASRAAFHNQQRGTYGVAGRGTNTNLYTGNTIGGRGALAYNPNTGVVSGAGAGYSGNVYSGTGATGRGAFAYNTKTGAGLAAGGNNVYAGKDGSVYRYNQQNGSWSQNSGNGWQSTSKPQANLQQQQQMRSMGQQRSMNFGRSMSGGMRFGGGRRR
jgi:hypothetical protein